MPLPKLDTLRYDSLVNEARDVLPYRAPAWTDYNAHDPGVTMLELFAWLTESNSYRLDRVTSAAERAFLRLMGFEPEPARTALAVVVAQPNNAGPVTLPSKAQIANASGSVRFQISAGIRLVTAQLSKLVAKTKHGWTDWTTANASLESSFLPLGDSPAAGDALYFGFSAPLGIAGERAGLFLFGEDLRRDYETWRNLRDEHRRLRRMFHRACKRPSDAVESFWNHYGVTVAWEYFNGTSWSALDRVRDATRALSLSGPVRFRLSTQTHAKGGVPGADDCWFIRCRIVKGRYDCAPKIRGARVNAVLCRHAADNPRINLPDSMGHARQRFFVTEQPIVPGSTRLEVDGHSPGEWEERPNFDRSGPLARHYIVDRSAGEIVFGDGRHGVVPEAGATLSVSWQTGSGTTGNVPAKTLTNVPGIGAAMTVEQPMDAFGGVDTETLPLAKARAVRLLAESRCAVTLEDLERLALATPGVSVVRARAVAEFHPRFECLPAGGCITVVVITNCVRLHPRPTDALRSTVKRYLDARRPVAVELHVTGPQWTRVTVRASLRVHGELNGAAIRAEARRRIDGFLDPLTGGPDGKGWPIGRSVYRSEIYAVLHEVPGVASVDQLSLQSCDDHQDLCNSLELCPHGMPLPGLHEITTRSAQ